MSSKHFGFSSGGSSGAELKPRRSWPRALKHEIAAESFVPGVVPADVARKHRITGGQLSGWRRDYRAELARASGGGHPSFVEVAFAESPPANLEQSSGLSAPVLVIDMIEVVMSNGHMVRIGQSCDATLRLVLDALASR